MWWRRLGLSPAAPHLQARHGHDHPRPFRRWWSAQRLCAGKWSVSRLAGRGIRPIPRGALPRAYATGYAGFGVHVRVPVPHLCSSEQRAAGGRRLTCRRWAAPRRCLGQASRADKPAGARRALGGHSAGNGAAAHHERGDGHQPPPRFISVEAGRCELEAQIFPAQKCR